MGSIVAAGLVLGYALVLFVRDGRARSGAGLAVAVAAHVGLFLVSPVPESPRPENLAPLEFHEIPEVVPEPPAPVEEAEPEVEPEPTQDAEPARQRRQPVVPKRRDRRRRPTEASAPEPAGPKRFDPGKLNQGESSGVSVQAGRGGGSGLGGSGDGAGTKPGRAGSREGGGTVAPKPGDGWAPTARVLIAKLPVPQRVAKRQCPATRDGVEGTVHLRVQIRRDGSVRKVRLVKGIGNGCDKIAIAALRGARFKPAKSNANKPVDFEITYEYAFKLVR